MSVYTLNRPVSGLMQRACEVLHFTQKELAHALDASHSTGHRWIAGRATPTVTQVRKLAALVFPHDRALAEELAVASTATLEGLGLVRPPPPAPPLPPPPPPLPVTLVVDSVVCAAAEALDQPPRVVRGVLHAAFERARRLDLSIDDIARALAPPAPPPPEAAGKAAKGAKPNA